MKKLTLILSIPLLVSATISAQSKSGLLSDFLRQVKQERDTTHAPVDTTRADTLNPRK